MILLSIINFLTNEKILPILISTVTTIIVFFLTLLTKNYIETKVLRSKLDTEHKFDQRKKIKEVLAKYKVHLLTACEDFNHRMWNFSNKHQEKWLEVNVDYLNKHYYFDSFVYRHLAIFAWTKKIQKEMIFLDTTIAGKADLEFVKFLNVFSRMFCDLTFIEGLNANGNKTDDHFFRNEFDLFADSLITETGVKSFSEYLDDINNIAPKINRLFLFFDSLSPNEERKRWDRLHFFHLTILMFLNNYGYDFQITNNEKLEQVLTSPKKSSYLDNYFLFLKEYHLTDNKQIKILKKIAKKVKKKGPLTTYWKNNNLKEKLKILASKLFTITKS
ncbi:hypothetical protein EB1_05340 [Empedobacter brevis NBRC 14943 = ATCC 43319]|uniref:Uncharacterized protein n=1 Tax=Empedobacter brevis NBRC 14943 = ATCC 43319 TaxID=1218108 RepID=A0A511ND47_9FLAO|nr:hypothetical protein [Empedobacter brevis]GEM50744.1 hypothetical protein EB1_05340 [Empedobacter brevis NBRC 14943 = ATCC 43319]